MQRRRPRRINGRSSELLQLQARPITYIYRYCPNCQREWPAKHSSCPVCVHWLGDRPLERTEWKLAPSTHDPLTAAGYERVHANALTLQITCSHVVEDVFTKIAQELNLILQSGGDRFTLAVPEQGWLIWTKEGPRRAFQQGLEFEGRLAVSLEQLERLLYRPRLFRWGLWLDQYIVPFSRHGTPTISRLTSNAIFNFEPESRFLCSEEVYNTNRRWEHFVCVPRRLLRGKEGNGYRFLSHKRPSALDHHDVLDVTPFIGRQDELAFLTERFRESQRAHTRAGIIAEAGSGKTRLIREWRHRNSDVRIVTANSSLFAGDMVSLAGQLTQLPPDAITSESLLRSILVRLEVDRVDALVFDDVHWADPESLTFIEDLLDALRSRAILVLLIARPSGRKNIQLLHPQTILDLHSLPLSDMLELARGLISPDHIARIAAARSEGKPLFVEQFAAWAVEAKYQGRGEAPRNLFQLIAARIAHLSTLQLSMIRQKLQWGPSSDHSSIHQELDLLEKQIGLWLDRLETGDYGDRIEASRHLIGLEHVDFEIFLASNLAGKPRARSSRLREAIDRLISGSAVDILADLKRRAVNADEAQRMSILHEAQRAGEAVAGRYGWALAADFYELALAFADTHQQGALARKLADCRRRCSGAPAFAVLSPEAHNLEENPAIDNLKLPEIWLQLATRYQSTEYLQRAISAAKAIDDRALVTIAKQIMARPPKLEAH